MAHKPYPYIGPHNLRRLLEHPAERHLIANPADLLAWLDRSVARPRRARAQTATFIIDTEGQLWIADQRSEHVVCARGQPVLAAGELTAEATDRQVCVAGVTNQSTGYCPAPATWAVVSEVLRGIGLEHPEEFTHVYIFRRCASCGMITIVKDGIYECAVCAAVLDTAIVG
ncbi:MAG TPA: hypothetical protein VFS21_11305 [Roseiflexaceae bacterium]|nr:hypothetical protein [Roseiflexaceae bacterium]